MCVCVCGGSAASQKGGLLEKERESERETD